MIETKEQALARLYSFVPKEWLPDNCRADLESGSAYAISKTADFFQKQYLKEKLKN